MITEITINEVIVDVNLNVTEIIDTVVITINDVAIGVPAGGLTGQILAKKTDIDFDTEWVNGGGGGGAVDSVNGETGVVVLDLQDITNAGNSTNINLYIYDNDEGIFTQATDLSSTQITPFGLRLNKSSSSGILDISTDVINNSYTANFPDKPSGIETIAMLSDIPTATTPNLQDVTDEGNETTNPLIVKVGSDYTEVTEDGINLHNALANAVHRISNNGASANAVFVTPNKAGLHTLATTEDTVTEVIGGTNISVNSSDPTKPIVSAIPSTSAGVFDRAYFTGQVETDLIVGVTPVYETLKNGKGSVASVQLVATNILNAGVKSFIPNDMIGASSTLAFTIPIGNYSSFLSVLPSNASGTKRLTMELFLCNSDGSIVDSVGPVSADTTGIYAGKNTMVVLDSGEITLAAANDIVGLTGYVNTPVALAVGQRIRYHISAARTGGTAPAQTMTVNIGNAWNSYIEAPVPITTSTVINVSNKLGATQTDVNNILVEGAASSTTDYVPQWADTTGKLLKAGKRVQTNQTDVTAGSLMNVGAFGLGSSFNNMPPLVVDCNGVSVNGFYYCNTSTTNTPIDLSSFSLIHTRVTGSQGQNQIAMELASGKMFIRSCDNGGLWSEWVEVGKRYYNGYTSASVSGTFQIDFTKLVQRITLTGNVIFQNLNLPVTPKTIVIELIVSGAFAIDLTQTGWEALPGNDNYDGTKRNHFIITVPNFTGSAIIYSLKNLAT